MLSLYISLCWNKWSFRFNFQLNTVTTLCLCSGQVYAQKPFDQGKEKIIFQLKITVLVTTDLTRAVFLSKMSVFYCHKLGWNFSQSLPENIPLCHVHKKVEKPWSLVRNIQLQEILKNLTQTDVSDMYNIPWHVTFYSGDWAEFWLCVTLTFGNQTSEKQNSDRGPLDNILSNGGPWSVFIHSV